MSFIVLYYMGFIGRSYLSHSCKYLKNQENIVGIGINYAVNAIIKIIMVNLTRY